MNAQKILIVEDEQAVAKGVEYALQSEGYETLWADTGRKALQLVSQKSPHLILLDIRLPDMSGFDICRQLRANGNRQPILMLTAKDEEFDRVLGLELGADDYIVKPYSLRELISRIRAQLRRAYGELAALGEVEQIIQFGAVSVNLAKMTAQKSGQPLFLTPTEFRLLRYLAEHAGMPRSRDSIIEAVWGYSSHIGNDRTIDVHIRHLREKVEADPKNPRYLLTVRGIGYKFQTD